MRIRFSRQDAKDAENRRIKQRKEIRQDVGLKKKVTKGYEKLREVAQKKIENNEPQRRRAPRGGRRFLVTSLWLLD